MTKKRRRRREKTRQQQKTVRLRENVWLREKENQKKIPDENASYGEYAIFMENRPKEREQKRRIYMYTQNKKKRKGFLSICWFANINRNTCAKATHNLIFHFMFGFNRYSVCSNKYLQRR